MDWNWTTLLWIGGFVLLVWFMVRACGGMMRGGGGCCGMGRSRENTRPEHQDTSENYQERKLH